VAHGGVSRRELQHPPSSEAIQMTDDDGEYISGKISGELAELFHQYKDERGYNKSQAQRRLFEEALLNENTTALRRLVDLRQEIQELKEEVDKVERIGARLDSLEESVGKQGVKNDRIANLEDRMRRLESLEWESRKAAVEEGEADE
jgi:hypothetical protein